MDRLNLKIIIAGEFYENAEPYFEKIKALYLQDRLVMRNDFIPNSDVANYFNAADAVIQPYTSATQSGVTQIAYYYNKPMIVTNVGGLAELVPHGKSGLVCNPNAEALAANIVKLYEEELIDKLTQGACEEKQRFTWDTLIQKLFELVKL
jgi:glycosyltransferase involved in cell wall biosynthesis